MESCKSTSHHQILQHAMAKQGKISAIAYRSYRTVVLVQAPNITRIFIVADDVVRIRTNGSTGNGKHPTSGQDSRGSSDRGGQHGDG
jgi:hypothetical protein